jgi:hypothetical protein
MRKIIYVLIIIIFVLFCIEIFFRIVNVGKVVVEEKNFVYQYNNILGWFPESNKEITIVDFIGKRKYINNSLGFRDIEHDYKDQNKDRIMFIGDSFCFGFGVNQNEVFVELLRDKLKEKELFNCGVSGYSTDQEFILLQMYFDLIKPKIVFLVLCVENDFQETQQNIVVYEYFKPYFFKEGNELILKGVPIPKTWLYYRNNFFVKYSRFINVLLRIYIIIKHPLSFTNDANIAFNIILAMQSFLNDKGCNFIIGLTKKNTQIEDFCLKNNIKYIILENDNTRSETDFHWNEKGHQYVADKIYKFFEEENMLN